MDDSVSAVRERRRIPLPVVLGIFRAEDRDVPRGERNIRGLLQSATRGARSVRAQTSARSRSIRSEAGSRDGSVQAETRGTGAFDEAGGQASEADRRRLDVHVEKIT